VLRLGVRNLSKGTCRMLHMGFCRTILTHEYHLFLFLAAADLYPMWSACLQLSMKLLCLCIIRITCRPKRYGRGFYDLKITTYIDLITSKHGICGLACTSTLLQATSDKEALNAESHSASTYSQSALGTDHDVNVQIGYLCLPLLQLFTASDYQRHSRVR